MQAGQPSQTAIGTAAFRAIHAYGLPGPTIHEDEYAMRLVGVDDVDQLIALMRLQVPQFLEAACAYFAFRHRFAEDLMLAAINAGTRQVVVLGAGLDSFALRHRELVAGLDFFEVDHPDTQAWKLARLDAADLGRPPVNYVAVDFDRESAVDLLAASGLRLDESLFVTWLGVSQYVERADALRTLMLAARGQPASEVVFDIVLPAESHTEGSWDADLSEVFAERSAERGEPWITTYETDELGAALSSLGFTDVHHLSPEDAARRYYQGQPPEVTPPSAWRLVHAVR